MKFEKNRGPLEERALIRYRLPHQLVELQSFALKLKLASRDPGQVEKAVNQPSELVDLCLDDRRL